ncbi:hypothetical protein D9756_010153 [Leucocoprinus leucothites]|uniref:Nephrocystin 3-like N-terminal domain-containing protein n=1 Tax=Leucocoprinus leucothites TaxID=201217 RepID=A0A8H5CU47_9AGAR|nr:hypothetical protein D9756_010153 [Leucoagaricus leucothites]
MSVSFTSCDTAILLFLPQHPLSCHSRHAIPHPVSLATSTVTSPSSALDRHLSIQEDSVQGRIPPGYNETSYLPSQAGDMDSKAPGKDLMSLASNSIVQNPSFLTGAHDFTIDNLVIGANDRPDIERKMLKLLEKKAMVDATYDSAARHYTAPQCHPDTRVSLRERLINWLLDTNRAESLFWLYGPAGVGKSAMAQNIMEYCAQQGFPRAGLFLSRANGRDDPNRIVPSLAHQLALAYPAFSRRISEALNADPTILEKRLPHQFQQLIHEPVDALRIKTPNSTPHPILLLLDGLDECSTQDAQCELIKAFASFSLAFKARQLPFVCIITSRPEWQIVSTFDALGPASGVRQEELSMNTPAARLDVSITLSGPLAPMCSQSSPLRPLLASLVVACVDDDDPTAQLELCLRSLQGKLTSDERNPFEPLTALYRGLVLSIPLTLRRTALLILYATLTIREDAILIDNTIPAQAIANFLFIGQTAFYGSLRRLRSVLSVPAPTDAHYKRLEFSHTTFADYVKVAVQAGHFGLHEVDALAEIRAACIKWHRILGPTPEEVTSENLSDIVPWIGKTSPSMICIHAMAVLFKQWHGLLRRDVGKLQEELESFPFNDLLRRLHYYFLDYNLEEDEIMSIQEYPKRLVRDLVTNPKETWTWSSASTCIVRTVPLWPTDYQLIDKYVPLFGQLTTEVKPLDWDSAPPNLFDDRAAFHDIWDTNWCPTLSYFLLSHDQNTVLVIVHPHAMNRDAHWKETFTKMKTFDSISSDQSLLDLIETFPYDNEDYDNEDFGGSPLINSYDNLVCNIVSFVAGPWCPDPHSRLQIINDILSSNRDPEEIFCLICHHTLLNIPPNISHIAQQILAFIVITRCKFHSWQGALQLKDLQCFMGLDYATITSVLQWLHPLVFSWRPDPLDPNTAWLRFRVPEYDLCGNSISFPRLGTSFKHWSCIEEQAWVAVHGLWIEWSSWCLLTGDYSFLPSLFHGRALLDKTWAALGEIRTSHGLTTAATWLHDFPFCHLDRELFCGGMLSYEFADLIFRLSSNSVFAPLLRTQPNCPMDCLLLEKWVEIGHKSEFVKFPITVDIWTTKYYPISLSTTGIPPPRKKGYPIFLIGYGENTCLIVMRYCKLGHACGDDAEVLSDDDE